MISQIDHWINEDEHQNEVIMIHFNHDFAVENGNKTRKELIDYLARNWIYSDSSKFAIQSLIDATLRFAVNQNNTFPSCMHNV